MNSFMKKALSLFLAAVMLSSALVMGVYAENIDEAWDIGDNYVFYGTFLSLGEAEYEMSGLYDYTLFAFAPAETGKYTFSAEDTFIGIVSYNAMWVSIQPGGNTVAETSVSWECTGEGQEIWLAVKANGGAVKINVEASESERVVVEKIEYVNKTTPVPFEYKGVAEELINVNILNKGVDEAVLGKDGYYHLNAADGPILYANLSDSKMSLSGATGYGQLKGSQYNEEGQLIAIIDYNNAFAPYFECADPKSFLYPLTDDLIEMFKEVGSNQGWYGSGGWVGGNYDDAWMFACYYSDAPIITFTPGDVNDDGKINGIDSNTLKRVVVGALTLESGSASALAADVNGDGKINGQDSNYLKRLIAVGG